jgi:hypothetical protein
MDSVSEENVRKILQEKEDTEKLLNTLRNTSLAAMWKGELETLKKEYMEYKKERETLQGNATTITTDTKTKNTKTNSNKKKILVKK